MWNTALFHIKEVTWRVWDYIFHLYLTVHALKIIISLKFEIIQERKFYPKNRVIYLEFKLKSWSCVFSMSSYGFRLCTIVMCIGSITYIGFTVFWLLHVFKGHNWQTPCPTCWGFRNTVSDNLQTLHDDNLFVLFIQVLVTMTHFIFRSPLSIYFSCFQSFMCV